MKHIHPTCAGKFAGVFSVLFVLHAHLGNEVIAMMCFVAGVYCGLDALRNPDE